MFPGLNSPNALVFTSYVFSLHIGKGLGGVGEEGLSVTKVCLQDKFLFWGRRAI